MFEKTRQRFEWVRKENDARMTKMVSLRGAGWLWAFITSQTMTGVGAGLMLGTIFATQGNIPWASWPMGTIVAGFGLYFWGLIYEYRKMNEMERELGKPEWVNALRARHRIWGRLLT